MNGDLLHPGLYRPEDDEGLSELREYALSAGTSDDSEWHQQELARFQPVFPTSTIKAVLNGAGAAQQVVQVLMPVLTEKGRAYLMSLGHTNSAATIIPEEAQLDFCIVATGDTLTMEHSLATGALSGGLVKALLREPFSQKTTLESEDVALSIATGTLHDIGKGEIPRFILQNPVDRGLLRAIYAANMGDERRLGHPVELPFPLTPEEWVRFGPLVRGECITPEDVLAFGQLCRERSGDFRVVPAHALRRFGNYLLKYNQLPPDVAEYAKVFLNERELSEVPYLIERLNTQRGDYQMAKVIMGRCGIHGFQDTMLGINARHVSASTCVLNDPFRTVVGFHHSGADAAVSNLNLREKYRVWILILADIIAALSQARPYFVNGKQKNLGEVRRILALESQKHSIPDEFTSWVVNEFLPSGESEDPLPLIIQKMQSFAVSI